MLAPYIEASISELKAQQDEHPGYKLHLDSPKRMGATLNYEVEPDHDIPPLYEGAIVTATWREERYQVELTVVSETRTVVVLDRPLPKECKRLTVTIDLTFILKKLIEFLQEADMGPNALTISLCQKTVASLSGVPVSTSNIPELNPTQNAAITRMASRQFHLLWGPPGTGKTTTLGHLAARLIKQGTSCLLLSISNAAVDELAQSTVGAYCGEDLGQAVGKILRYGNAQSPLLQSLSALYHNVPGEPNPIERLALLKDKRQSQSAKFLDLQAQGIAPDSAAMKELGASICRLSSEIQALQGKERIIATDALPFVTCVATTLARCVTDRKVRARRYDVVIVDECSMVPLPYAFVATQLAREKVIFGGDPKQLPPIVNSHGPTAKNFYGRNVFQFLGIDKPSENPQLCSFLDRQYRMTPRIREIVSALLYDDALVDGSESTGQGRIPLFIEVDGELCRTFYSVSQKSYFNPLIILIIKALQEWKEIDSEKGSLLTLSPFRSQQALMRSVLDDYVSEPRSFRVRASTIHKSQGGQAHTVLVDLTSHGAMEKPPRFFCEDTCTHLLNVALSRAQKRLIIVGNRQFIHKISKAYPFFSRLEGMLSDGHFRCCSLDKLFKVLPNVSRREWLESLKDSKDPSETHLIEWPDDLLNESEMKSIQAIPGDQKCIVRVGEVSPSAICHGITNRHDREGNLPSIGFSNGRVLLRHKRQYFPLEAPKSGVRAISITMAHLYDGFTDIHAANRILCDTCEVMMTPQQSFGVTFLKCPNGHQRPCSEKDLSILAALYKVTCPECGAIMTGRKGNKDVFLGCSNYPACTSTKKPSFLLDGATCGTNKD